MTPYLEKYIKKLIGNTEIEDSLQRLDKLTQNEKLIASAELLKITHNVNCSLSLTPAHLSECSDIFTGNQLRDSLFRWLSPPDPSINHNVACKAHHNGTAQWFLQGSIFNQWKSTDPFLWIHGKRALLLAFIM